MRRPVGALIAFLLTAFMLGPGSPGSLLAQTGQEGPPGGSAGAAGAGQPGATVPATASEPAPLVLSLEECLKAALENNLDIVVRRYDPLRSEALVLQQESVFDPTLSGTATASRNTDPRPTSFFRSDKGEVYTASFDDPLVTGGHYRVDVTGSNDKPITLISPNGDPQYNTSLLLTVTQPLLRNFGPKASRWQIVVAKTNLGISAAQFRQTVIDTLSTAEKAYWDLNFTLMDLKTKQGSLRLAQDFLDQNRIKVRVGTLAPIEITQAEAGVASREEEVIVAENAVSTAEDAIRRIMNVPPASPIWNQPIRPGDPPPVQEVSPDMEAAVATAQGSRPDLEQARQTVASREAELAFRRNQRRWGLDFKGTYGPQGFAENNPPTDPHGSYGDAFSDLSNGGKENWSLGLALSVPLGNRQATSNFTNAEYGLTQARFDLER
ncbi:MAG TPA: TolC family protein, partial [Candidatus Polarisedimenticolia bacterium]